VDLVKQSERREREVIVGNEFRHSIEYLNAFIDDEHKIRYCALDYSHVSKHRNLDVSSGTGRSFFCYVLQTYFTILLVTLYMFYKQLYTRSLVGLSTKQDFFVAIPNGSSRPKV